MDTDPFTSRPRAERERMVDRSLAWIDAAHWGHKPIATFGLFSGGDDSMTSCHIAARHPKFTAMIHINTGIGIERTRVFVRETCKKYGWPLREYFAKDCGQDYRELCKQYGFPGPGQHTTMYIRLKERALRVAVRAAKVGAKRKDRILLITGVRASESERRMGTVGIFERRDASLWLNPIYDWQKGDCLDYIGDNKIERNPVAALIHKSGECLCGAFAKQPHELKEIEYWFPEVGREIRAIEAEVKAAGKAACRWGERPPSSRSGKKGRSIDRMPMCHGCEKQRVEAT